ncbi:hypothetical protein ACWJKU_02005 [Methylocaldum sp. MU1018]
MITRVDHRLELAGHAGRQDVVLNKVEKFRQAQVDGDTVTGLNMALYESYRKCTGYF